MSRSLLEICPVVVAAALLAGCGTDGERLASTPSVAARPAPRPATVTVPASFRSYSEPRAGVSLRYPRSFTREGRLPGSLLLRGGPQTVCVVALTSSPPLDTPAAQRRFAAEQADRLRRSGGGDVVIRSSGPEAGANVKGAGVVYRLTAGGESGHSALLASAGGAVSLQCSAPEADFARLERTAFGPIIASVTLRQAPGAEALHRRLAALPGVRTVSVRAQRRGLVINARLSAPGPRPAAIVRSIVEAAARALPGRDVSVLAHPAHDPASPVLGRWEARLRRGSVEEVGKPPQTIRLG